MLRPPVPVHPYQESGYGGPSTEAAAMVLQFMAAAAESGPPANVQPHSSQPPGTVRWVEHVPQVTGPVVTQWQCQPAGGPWVPWGGWGGVGHKRATR